MTLARPSRNLSGVIRQERLTGTALSSRLEAVTIRQDATVIAD